MPAYLKWVGQMVIFGPEWKAKACRTMLDCASDDDFKDFLRDVRQGNEDVGELCQTWHELWLAQAPLNNNPQHILRQTPMSLQEAVGEIQEEEEEEEDKPAAPEDDDESDEEEEDEEEDDKPAAPEEDDESEEEEDDDELQDSNMQVVQDVS